MQSSSRLRDSLRTIVKSLGHYSPAETALPRLSANTGELRRHGIRFQQHLALKNYDSNLHSLDDSLSKPTRYFLGGDAEQSNVARQPQVPSDTPKYEPGVSLDGNPHPEYRRAVLRSINRSRLSKSNLTRIHSRRHGGKSLDTSDAIRRMLKEPVQEDLNPYICRKETLQLRSGEAVRFKSDANEAVLEVFLRTGCHVQKKALRKVDNESDGRTFAALSLWGTHAQNSEAVRLLTDMVEHVPCDGLGLDQQHASQNAAWRLDESAQESKYSVVRTTWTTSPTKTESVEETLRQRPSVWTPITFANYVRLLTIDCLYLKRGKRIEQSGVDRIMEELHYLVTSGPDLAHCITSEAVDNMIDFMLKHSRMTDLKLIFNALESSPRYRPSASNYDTFLEHAASKQDMYNFQRLLHTMLEKELKPTWRTWASLYRLAYRSSDYALAAHVFRAMRGKGVLDNAQAIKAVAANRIRNDIRMHYKRNGNLSELLAIYDRKFAPSSPAPLAGNGGLGHNRLWASTEALTFAVEELLKLGKHVDAIEIASGFAQYAKSLPEAMVRSLLLGAVWGRDMAAAVSVISRYRVELGRKEKSAKKTAEVFSLLFKLAWETCSLNVLRVVWRYACLRAQLTFSDVLTVRQSLTLSPLSESNERWLAGQDLNKPVTSEDMVSEKLHQELDLILGDSPQPETRSVAKHGDDISYEAEFFKRWAGNFVTGISDGLEAENSMTTPSGLTLHEHLMVEYACTPRWTDTLEHQQRMQECRRLVRKDQEGWAHWRAIDSFYVKLEEAWRLDQEWKVQAAGSLGPFSLPSQEQLAKMDQDQRREKVFDGFRRLCTWMMCQGVRVPVRKKRNHRYEAETILCN